MPLEYMRRPLPSGLYSKTIARSFSAGVVSGSSTFECEPTLAYIFLPSGENAISRVEWPPVAKAFSTTTSFGAVAFEIAGLVGEADHRIGVGDVHELRIVAGWEERDAERAVQVGREDLHLLRLAGRVPAPQDADPAWTGLGDEQSPLGAVRISRGFSSPSA